MASSQCPICPKKYLNSIFLQKHHQNDHNLHNQDFKTYQQIKKYQTKKNLKSTKSIIQNYSTDPSFYNSKYPSFNEIIPTITKHLTILNKILSQFNPKIYQVSFFSEVDILPNPTLVINTFNLKEISQSSIGKEPQKRLLVIDQQKEIHVNSLLCEPNSTSKIYYGKFNNQKFILSILNQTYFSTCPEYNKSIELFINSI